MSLENDSLVRLTVDGAVATIELNRPDKHNALSMAMVERLESYVAELEARRDVRVVILTGAGERSFCVGADIKEWDRLSGDDPVAMWRQWDRPGHRVFDRLARLQQPTLAAINGLCLGGGLELALCADLRLAAAHAEFALPETRIGTQPGWTGTQRLPKVIGVARAKQMIFTAARVDALTAEKWGLVNEVVPAERLSARAADLAQQIAANAPLAVQFAKAIIDAGAGEGAAMALEGLAAALSAATEDGREGPRSFREKRPPRFTGR
jgi:enoyl-CoA hydratase/carnithine racemase